jgi:hypothetical protein
MEEPRRPSHPDLAGHKVTSSRPGKATLSAPWAAFRAAYINLDAYPKTSGGPVER